MGTGKLSRKPGEMLGLTCDGLASNLRGVSKLLVTSCYKPGTIILSFFFLVQFASLKEIMMYTEGICVTRGDKAAR